METIRNFNTTRQLDIQTYIRTLLKVKILCLHILFNKTCIRENLTPKFINFKTNNKSKIAQIAKRTAEKTFLKLNLKKLYAKKDELNTRLLNIHLKLANIYGPNLVNEIIEHTKIHIKSKLQKIKNTHAKKIANLQPPVTPAITSSHTFYQRTLNLTTVIFDKNETELINKGLKHNISHKNRDFKDLILDAETAISQTTFEDQDPLRIKTKESLGVKKDLENSNTHTLNSIIRKIKTNKLTFTKADKGNTTVIINTDDLNKKVDEFIEDNKITALKKDPTNKFQTHIKNKINSAKFCIPTVIKPHLKITKPAAPTLQALPKIHKKEIPIRPIVKYHTAPAYKIAKHLNSILKQHLNINIAKTSIINSTDLVNKIKNLNIPHTSTLASFDIKNLYTNIPVNETIDIIKTQLLLKLPTDHTNEIIDLLRSTTEQNYFTHNNKFYTQPNGLPMGSPISGTMAEIFLQHIEQNKILNHNKYTKKIIYWFRYVDDIIVLYNGNKRQCETFFKYINTVHQNLNFTAEYEDNNTLNFLDLSIIKDQNQKHKFNIYRKPTTTDTLIHNTSNHPIQHKHAAFRSMIHRLNNIPLDTHDYNTELNTIRYLAQVNGYKPNLIDSLTHKIKNKKKNTVNPNTTDEYKYIPLTFINNQSYKIARHLNKYGYKTSFKTTNSLKIRLKNKKPNTDPYLSAGVYKINCSDCDSAYVGQTGRTFEKRYKEHIAALNTTSESAFATHLIETGHSHKNIKQNMEILHITHNKRKRNTLEQFEIYKHSKLAPKSTDILNEQLNFKSHILFDRILFDTQHTRRQSFKSLTDNPDRAEDATQSVAKPSTH